MGLQSASGGPSMTTTTKIILLVLGLVLLAGVGHGITGSTRPVMSSSRYAW